jgi:integrase
MPYRYRLPLLVLDDTGMRISELETLEWRDIDEPRGRWRIRKTASKTNRARWVTPSPAIFQAIVELCPREDRQPASQVLDRFSGDAFRTQLGRVCKAAAIPAFSPHDLRHRRISLMHLSGIPWARIGEHVGQRSIAITADTYTHVLLDETELDYPLLLRRDHPVPPSVLPTAATNAH